MTREPDGLAEGLFIQREERDPLRAAAQGARPELPKRFYKAAEVAANDGGFAVVLDGKTVKTPGRRLVVTPSLALAQAQAEEWARQGERIDPSSMPLTRLVNSAIDGVAGQMGEVEADVVKYGRSDLVSYRASEPVRLALAQAKAWNPLVVFAEEKLGAELVSTEGVIFVEQPETAVRALALAIRRYVGDDAASPFRLAALHIMTTLTGSSVIALAVAHREIDVDAAWTAAHVDEDFQMNAWGFDEEALVRRQRRFEEMKAAAFVSNAMGFPPET
ncbi:MAG: ATPase [Methylocystaceae bacterium]|nr:MAG: ATPase [Methylocystaceae bacterium]